jgi:hypothetical protein
MTRREFTVAAWPRSPAILILDAAKAAHGKGRHLNVVSHLRWAESASPPVLSSA